MARISKEYDERKKELLEAGGELFLRKGYESTSVNDILTKVGVAKGTFYYYFKSKEELLEQITVNITEKGLMSWIPIIENKTLDALGKLNLIFAISNQFKLEIRPLNLALLKALYRDDNLLLRYKLNQKRIEQAVDYLVTIFKQGMDEGIFSISHPREVVKIILRMGESLLDDIVPLLLTADKQPENINKIIIYYNVMTRAMERILGVHENSLHFFDENSFKEYFTAPS